MPQQKDLNNSLLEIRFINSIAKCDIRSLQSLLKEFRNKVDEEEYNLKLYCIFSNFEPNIRQFFHNKLGHKLKNKTGKELINLKLDMINGIWNYIPDRLKNDWAISFLHIPIFNNAENQNTNKVIIAAIDIAINTPENSEEEKKEKNITQGVITFLNNMKILENMKDNIAKDINEILLASLLVKPDKFTLFMKNCYKKEYSHIDNKEEILKLDQYIESYDRKMPLEIFSIIRSFLLPSVSYINPIGKHRLDDDNTHIETLSNKRQKL